MIGGKGVVQQPSGDIYLNLASAYTQGFMI